MVGSGKLIRFFVNPKPYTLNPERSQQRPPAFPSSFLSLSPSGGFSFSGGRGAGAISTWPAQMASKGGRNRNFPGQKGPKKGLSPTKLQWAHGNVGSST